MKNTMNVFSCLAFTHAYNGLLKAGRGKAEDPGADWETMQELASTMAEATPEHLGDVPVSVFLYELCEDALPEFLLKQGIAAFDGEDLVYNPDTKAVTEFVTQWVNEHQGWPNVTAA